MTEKERERERSPPKKKTKINLLPFTLILSKVGEITGES